MPKNDFLASWQTFFVKRIRTFCFPWCLSKITLGIIMSIVIETTKGVFTVDLYIEQRPKGKFKFWCIIVRDRWRKFESWNIHKECGTNFFSYYVFLKNAKHPFFPFQYARISSNFAKSNFTIWICFILFNPTSFLKLEQVWTQILTRLGSQFIEGCMATRRPFLKEISFLP